MSKIPTVMDCGGCIHYYENNGFRNGVCSGCFGGWPNGKPSAYEGQVTTFSTGTDSSQATAQAEVLNCQRFNDGKSAMAAWNRETNRNIDFADWMYLEYKKEEVELPGD